MRLTPTPPAGETSVPFENTINYPDDQKHVIHDEFEKIIQNSGWEDDIQAATLSLEQSAGDAETLRERAAATIAPR